MSSATLEKDEQAAPAPATTRRRTAAAKAVPAAAEDAKVVIRPIATETLIIRVVGTAPLIVSRFSEKAKRMMLEAQQNVKREKEVRNPMEEFENSLYRAGLATAADAADLGWTMEGPDGPVTWSVDEGCQLYGLPAMAFKMATIGAARLYGKAVKMTELRQYMYFDGRQIATEASRMTIVQGDPEMREDMVRLAGINRPADLRYRGCFYNWQADLVVRYTQNRLDRDSLVSLIEAGGMTVGVGEWRPERDGEFGTYQVSDTIPIRVLKGGKSG